MSYWVALIMGTLQGLTEFLPISSSGHLALTSRWIGLEIEASEQLYLSIFLHFSTAMSTVWVLRRRIGALLCSVFDRRRAEERRYLLYLLLSALPAACVGLLFRQELEAFFVGQTARIGGCFLLTALMLGWGQWISSRHSNDSESQLSNAPKLRVVLGMGLAQALALLPGVSRSGATIALGLALGSSRRAAAEFSFLMALIPILGGASLSVMELMATNHAASSAPLLGPMVVAAVTAFVVGCWACRRMITWVERSRMHYFSVYCVALGLSAIASSL